MVYFSSFVMERMYCSNTAEMLLCIDVYIKESLNRSQVLFYSVLFFLLYLWGFFCLYGTFYTASSWLVPSSAINNQLILWNSMPYVMFNTDKRTNYMFTIDQNRDIFFIRPSVVFPRPPVFVSGNTQRHFPLKFDLSKKASSKGALVIV